MLNHYCSSKVYLVYLVGQRLIHTQATKFQVLLKYVTHGDVDMNLIAGEKVQGAFVPHGDALSFN